jgi:hypothetical protein
VFGTCAGMILVARHAVDRLPDQRFLADRHRGAPKRIWRQVAVSRRASSWPVTSAADGVFIRAPWIESAGAGVEVLARHEGHPVAAVRATCWCAFHPELTPDNRLHRRFAEMVGARRGRWRHERSLQGSTIKHKKGAEDKKRASSSPSSARAIIVAAKEGSADPWQRLMAAAVAGPAPPMPKDNIERAIQRSAGAAGLGCRDRRYGLRAGRSRSSSRR